MHVYRLTQSHPYLEPIQRWYEEAFPINERRQFSELVGMLSYPNMQFCALLNQEQLVGFIIYWTLSDIVFIEHFAIAPTHRDKGFGQQALTYVLNKPYRYCVLEVERPEDALSQRRVRFYERAGFTLAPFLYRQPPYNPEKPTVPMCLMATPAIQTENEFIHLTALIREQVYERFY